MIRLRKAGGVAALAAALLLTGCASTFSGYDLAPNGLPRAEDALRRELVDRPEDAYATVLEGGRDLPDDDLLRLLYAATAARYAGAYLDGGHLLDLASYLAEDRRTMSVSRQALSMVTSDRALAYVPGRTERLVIPYLAATTFLAAGDLGGAVVEARRIEALLDREGLPAGAASDGDIPVDRRFFHTFAGVIFEAAGEWNDASVAYRRAGLDDGALEGRPAPADSTGEVVVVVESGFVPHRVEQSVAVMLPPWQVHRLTEGSAGEKVAAATEAAAHVLLAAQRLYGDRSAYYRDHGYRREVRLDPWDHPDCGRRKDDRCVETTDETPYLLRISWPVLYQPTAPPPVVQIRAGELGVDAVARLDVAAGVRDDFADDRGAMLARTVLRATSKMALTSAAREAVEKKDEVAGEVVGILANLGTFLTERADTRCWHLLPAQVSLVRLRLPAGTHHLEAELGGDAREGGFLSLGTVRVEPGRTTFVTHRIWR
jgi:hypothetical protein